MNMVESQENQQPLDWPGSQTLVGYEDEPGPTSGSSVPFDVSLLALAAVDGINQKALRALVKRLGDGLGAVWESDPERLGDLLATARVGEADQLSTNLASRRAELLDKASQELRDLNSRSITVVAPSRVPSKLADLPDRPWWLFVEGNPSALDGGPHIAVVGTRSPTPYGNKATEAAVRTMAAYPLTLVSGLADGIDATAHAVALRDGVQNVAFLGHGVNLTFPEATAEIRRRIVESGGAVVSEYMPNERFRRQSFVQRNRLQAGLADIVVPVEGTASGGTSHTVRFATKYARQIIGFQWEGVGDLVHLIAEQPRSAVLNVFDDEGRRELDRYFRELADSTGCDTYALRLVEHLLERETRLRKTRPSDYAHLRARVEHLARGVR